MDSTQSNRQTGGESAGFAMVAAVIVVTAVAILLCLGEGVYARWVEICGMVI